MSVLIDRIKIAIYAIYKGIIKAKSKNSKDVLIIFQQVFGDSVVVSSSLQEYVKLFPASEGYHIKMIVRPAVFEFMRSNFPIPKEIQYIKVDFTKLVNNYDYFRKIESQFCSNCYISIVPGTSLSAELLSDVTSAAKRIGLVTGVQRTWPPHMWLFQKLAYTDVVIPDKNEMMLQRHRRLLNFLGDKDFRAKLPTAINQEKIINEQQYFVMCPGSSKMEKCWPIDRFAEVADYLIDTYGVNVHVCGGADEKHFEEELMALVKHKTKVVSHIGSTTFAEWSSIVQYADLVIGNDSATMHLAAAHRRKSICISGVYDKYQFFPYKVDILDEGDRLPVTVLKDMSCEYCRTIGYDAGYKNPECTKKIKNNQCALCIDAITVDEVIENIDKLMRE